MFIKGSIWDNAKKNVITLEPQSIFPGQFSQFFGCFSRCNMRTAVGRDAKMRSVPKIAYSKATTTVLPSPFCRTVENTKTTAVSELR